MPSPSNKAAWLTSAKAKPLTVKEAPYPAPEAGEIVVKNAAVAINPVDVKIQDWDLFNIKYPNIIGSEIAGEVVAVKEGVEGFKVGMRVIGSTHGMITQNPKHGAFQHYSVLLATLCAPIPPTLPFTSAVVLPVGITTASAALYGPTLFALPLPVLAPPIPQSQSSTLVLWGGSSAVGLSTLQLARASGIEVIAVAGAHNFELCSSLGASRVFDHRDEAVVENVVRALEGKMCIGVFDTIGLTETIQAGVEILDKMDKGKGEKILVTTVPLMEALDLKAVEVKPVFSLSTLQSGIASAIWTDFLPAALASGAIIPQPPARIVGTGLESIQTGLDKSKEGYSATKLVVDLQRVPLSSGV